MANKIDLLAGPAREVFPAPVSLPVIQVSALTGAGMEALKTEITRLADSFQAIDKEDNIAINARHADALGHAKTCLHDALQKLENNGAVDLLASDLRGTLSAYGDILGKVDNERMLDHLFASFCIGK